MPDSVTKTDTDIATEEVADVGGSATNVATSQVADDEIKGEPTPTSASEEWKTKYEELSSKYEKDVANVKSALDKQLKSRDNDLEALRGELEKLQTAGMNEEQKKQYEASKLAKAYTDLQHKFQEQEAESEQKVQYYLWKDRFINEFGVKADELKLNQGIEALFSSGWDAIKTKLSASSQPQSSAEEDTKIVPSKPKGKTPPTTARPGSGVPKGEQTLKDLADKEAGGDLDLLFKKAEQNLKIRDAINEIVSKQTK